MVKQYDSVANIEMQANLKPLQPVHRPEHDKATDVSPRSTNSRNGFGERASRSRAAAATIQTYNRHTSDWLPLRTVVKPLMIMSTRSDYADKLQMA